MISLKKTSLLLLISGLCACAATPSPDDVKMSLALSAQGKNLLAEGKTVEARDVYLSAVSRDEQNARAWNGLGVAYALSGKRAKAHEAYEHALSLVPNSMTAANNLAQLYLEEGKPLNALELLERFVGKENAPEALKKNLARAQKEAAKAKATPQKPKGEKASAQNPDVYAELGSYPTKGIGEGYMTQAQKLLDDDNVTLTLENKTKVSGGTSVFILKATGRDPNSICRELTAQAFPCIPRGDS